MTLASLQIMPSNYAPTSEQCSNASEMLASNLRCPNATLASNKLTSWDAQSHLKESPRKQKKSKTFCLNSDFLKSKKALQRYIGFLNYYRNYIPRLSERLSPFFKLLKETSKFYVPTNLVEDFINLNKLLEISCQLALKQPLKDKQLIIMSDASFTAAGDAIMIEDDPIQKLQSKRKTYAPIAFGSKTFNPTQTKMSIHAKEFLSIYFAFVEFGHLMWGSTFPVIVFTDNRSVTRFFQAKRIPPALWNACDYVLQYNFVIAQMGINEHCRLPLTHRSQSS